MHHLQRAGGVAAVVEGATYIVGFGVMLGYLAPRGFIDAQGDPAASLTFLLENQVALYLWCLLIYLVAGGALVVLSLGIHDRLKNGSPALAQVSTAFGLIWSGLVLASGMVALVGQRAAVGLAADNRTEAVSSWSSTSVVQDALGGGIEMVGALWILLLSIAAVRTRLLPRGLAVLGIIIGVAGVSTLVPQAEAAAPVFGLGFIAWYLWAGRILMRG
ncbi:DUF4386 family protein [Nocardioides sp.]|uniref:DUF4386 family protein n=1 Tax=Nocardioides sp. TaxID=35761 RepID=UPI002C908C85|nr:DUF4386 family protein [Nocardioides sp.]HXH77165.1 DUF4386 family protein [Nocardioides sp.]